eukprot:m.158524 g.158524  ORF g.158524 m.158524 type:complete len:265 (+) comp31093_c0_seq1:432-1226(+)
MSSTSLHSHKPRAGSRVESFSEEEKMNLLLTTASKQRQLGQKHLVTGVLALQFFYDKTSNHLRVHIDKARGLRVKGGTPTYSSQPPSAYVRTYLASQPNEKAWKRKTQIVMKSADPVFAEDLTYENVLPEDKFLDDSLIIQVFAIRTIQTWNKEFLGQATIPIREGIVFCQNGQIEARLLPQDDRTPWHPTNVRTNPQGSSAADSAPTPPPILMPEPRASPPPYTSANTSNTTASIGTNNNNTNNNKVTYGRCATPLATMTWYV